MPMRYSPAMRFVAIAVAMHVAIVFAAWSGSGGNLTWFLHLGPDSEALPLARDVLDDVLVPLDVGHDGPKFWVLARDPLLLEPSTEASLDRPGYRARRIAYPAIAAPWRLIGEDSLLLGLVITNLVAVGVGTALALRIARHYGSRPRAALAVALNPAVIVALLFDLSDAVALAGLLAVIAGALERRRSWIVSGSLVAALGRETMVLGLVGMALLARGPGRRDRLLMVAPGVGALLAWTWYVRVATSDGSGGRELTAVPFSGWADAWRLAWRPQGDLENGVLAGLVLVVGLVVVALAVRRRDLLVAAAAPFAAILPFLGPIVLQYPFNLVRAVGPMLTLLPLAVDRVAPSARSAEALPRV
jgi:hypothetical protein